MNQKDVAQSEINILQILGYETDNKANYIFHIILLI